MEVGTQTLEIPDGPEVTDEALFAMLTDAGAVVTQEMLGATFDELSTIAAEQPDNKMVVEGIRRLVAEARDSGFVDTAMQMAMTLGAMACNHSHLEGLADEVGSLLGEKQVRGSNSRHDAASGHKGHQHEKHNAKTCKDCKKGSCKKR